MKRNEHTWTSKIYLPWWVCQSHIFLIKAYLAKTLKSGKFPAHFVQSDCFDFNYTITRSQDHCFLARFSHILGDFHILWYKSRQKRLSVDDGGRRSYKTPGSWNTSTGKKQGRIDISVLAFVLHEIEKEKCYDRSILASKIMFPILFTAMFAPGWIVPFNSKPQSLNPVDLTDEFYGTLMPVNFDALTNKRRARDSVWHFFIFFLFFFQLSCSIPVKAENYICSQGNRRGIEITASRVPAGKCERAHDLAFSLIVTVCSPSPSTLTKSSAPLAFF